MGVRCPPRLPNLLAEVVKLADTAVSKAAAAKHVGSSPIFGTNALVVELADTTGLNPVAIFSMSVQVALSAPKFSCPGSSRGRASDSRPDDADSSTAWGAIFSTVAKTVRHLPAKQVISGSIPLRASSFRKVRHNANVHWSRKPTLRLRPG